jgi:hypothetical protein
LKYNIPPSALQILEGLLKVVPSERITSREALKNPFFHHEKMALVKKEKF